MDYTSVCIHTSRTTFKASPSPIDLSTRKCAIQTYQVKWSFFHSTLTMNEVTALCPRSLKCFCPYRTQELNCSLNFTDQSTWWEPTYLSIYWYCLENGDEQYAPNNNSWNGTAVLHRVAIKLQNCHFQSYRTESQIVIAGESYTAVKDLTTNEFLALE